MHILPKGFVKTRNYGGFSNTKRTAYLERCRQLLGLAGDQPPSDHKQQLSADSATETPKHSPTCPHCGRPLPCLTRSARPGWHRTFSSSYRPPWYHDN